MEKKPGSRAMARSFLISTLQRERQFVGRSKHPPHIQSQTDLLLECGHEHKYNGDVITHGLTETTPKPLTHAFLTLSFCITLAVFRVYFFIYVC